MVFYVTDSQYFQNNSKLVDFTSDYFLLLCEVLNVKIMFILKILTNNYKKMNKYFYGALNDILIC